VNAEAAPKNAQASAAEAVQQCTSSAARVHD
jgi:hypothetical protein